MSLKTDFQLQMNVIFKYALKSRITVLIKINYANFTASCESYFNSYMLNCEHKPINSLLFRIFNVLSYVKAN